MPRSTTLERASGAFAREQRFVRWARIGVLAITVGFTGNLLLLDALARVFHDRVDNPDAAPRGLDALTTPLALAGGALGMYVFVVAGFVAIVVWSYFAAQSGAALGYHGRRNIDLSMASWAIPIINFWWPYEVIVDSLPRDARGRRWVLAWWVVWQVALYAAPLHFLNALFGWRALDAPFLVASLVVLVASAALGWIALGVVTGWHTAHAADAPELVPA